MTNEYLFYKIADSGLLFRYLHGVIKDKDGKKSFYFDRNKDVEEIINNFDENEYDY